MRGLLWWLPLLACTAGCWQARYFTPRENQNGTGPDGEPAAVYQVQTGADPATQGEVRIWSEGARAFFTDDDREVVELHIGFEVENNGAAALELDADALRCEELMIDGLLQDPLQPYQVIGDGTTPPGTTSRIDVLFWPPTTVPRSIEGFSVRFAVRAGEGRRVAQGAPFAPTPRRVRGQWAYDPWWGDPWWGPYGGAYWGGYGWGYGRWGVWGPGFWGPGYGYYGYCR